MTRRIALLASVMALTHTAAAWAQAITPASHPIVYSGLFTTRPDGQTSGFASQTGEYVGADLGGTLYLSPCNGMGAAGAGRPVSAFATDIWLMSGKVLELTDQQASVQVGWRRVRRAGQDETAPEQSRTLTMRRGERHNLDTIVVPATGSCDARSIALDVVFATRSEMLGITEQAYSRSGGGRSSSGARAGTVQNGARRGEAAGGGAISTAGSLQRLNADLWLVRSTPGRADETFHVTAQVLPIPIAYAFAPITIQTASGPVTVTVEGTVEAGSSPDGERRFHFAASRSVMSSTSNRPARDVKPVVEGSTKTTVAMPGPDEVLAFEMPPLRGTDGVTLPDRLSIRVRVSGSPAR